MSVQGICQSATHPSTILYYYLTITITNTITITVLYWIIIQHDIMIFIHVCILTLILILVPTVRPRRLRRPRFRSRASERCPCPGTSHPGMMRSSLRDVLRILCFKRRHGMTRRGHYRMMYECIRFQCDSLHALWWHDVPGMWQTHFFSLLTRY